MDAGWRVRRDGTLFWAEVVITAVYADSGALIGIRKVTRDASERRKAEQKFRDLLEAAPDAIVIVDQKGGIVLINSQTEKLFGYARANLLGQKVEALPPPRYRATHPAHRGNFFAAPNVRPMGLDSNCMANARTAPNFRSRSVSARLRRKRECWFPAQFAISAKQSDTKATYRQKMSSFRPS
jgi:protein-histidine pros-kinase